MNEFTRKAMSLADDYAEDLSSLYASQTECWRSLAYLQRKSQQAEAARSALLAHLEGGEQKPVATADEIRNACARGYSRCGFDSIANACVADGCQPDQVAYKPLTKKQRDDILASLRGIYTAKINKWSKLDTQRAEDIKAEAWGAEFVLIGILDKMLPATPTEEASK